MTGAVSGACVALSRLASATGPEGTSWLMVLIQATVAAQGGAALLWVVRTVLRWLVGRVSGSHAVRNAYMRDDTATYAVFLLTLATAIGVQLVAPVLWVLLALFVGAQAWVLRRARPRRMATDAERQKGAAVVLLFVAGVAVMLYAITWRRLLARQFGASADMSTLITAAFVAGLGLGVLAGARMGRWRPARLGLVFVVLQLLAALWGAASVALIPLVGAAVAGAAMSVTTAAVIAVSGVPMMLMGTALVALVESLPWPARTLDRSAGVLWGAALTGAAVAGILAVDVLFAFTGIRGTIFGAAALCLASALGSAVLFARQRPVDVPEGP
ncbi:MAG: hypothetical protein Q8K55_15725 [Gemmatimonadaceae bacterium]|nr:hypothetical protein [Gemmatimonadaceae bacterium]